MHEMFARGRREVHPPPVPAGGRVCGARVRRVNFCGLEFATCDHQVVAKRRVTDYGQPGRRSRRAGGIAPWLNMFLPVFAVQFAILGACMIYLFAFRDHAAPTGPGQVEARVTAPHRATARTRVAKAAHARKTPARKREAPARTTVLATPASVARADAARDRSGSRADLVVVVAAALAAATMLAGAVELLVARRRLRSP
jgi:hypothetical protein